MVNLPSQDCASKFVRHGMLIEFKYSKHSASVFTDRLLYKLEYNDFNWDLMCFGSVISSTSLPVTNFFKRVLVLFLFSKPKK